MINKKKPLVSVFMPVYNQERYVAAALESVLRQTYDSYEIVISDDCSKDSTPKIVQEFAEKYPSKIRFCKLSDKNLGGKHFEILLEQCKGEYVCMFSGDDIMYPEKIERQMHDVLKYELDFHGHSVDCVDEFGKSFSEIKVRGNKFFKSNCSFILNGVPTAGCSWLVKKSYAKFNHSLGFLHDFDMVIRVLSNGRTGYINEEKLGAYRVINSSWSKNLTVRDYWAAYINLATAWINSKMYLECVWLSFRVLLRLSSIPSKILNSR